MGGALIALSLWQSVQLLSLRQGVSANAEAIEGLKQDQRASVRPKGKVAPKVAAAKAAKPALKQRTEEPVIDARGEPPPFVDITSGYGRKQAPGVDCVKTCRALADCTLDGMACRGANTRNHDRTMDRCTDACKSDEKLGLALENGRNCEEKVTLARARLDGFSAFCDGKK